MTTSTKSKSTEASRILSRMFENNSFIFGEMESKEKDYFDQGTWAFQIKILDIDETDTSARIQLTARKKCPSGLWDNGIEKIFKPKMQLNNYEDLDAFVEAVISKNFISDYNKPGTAYEIIRHAVK